MTGKEKGSRRNYPAGAFFCGNIWEKVFFCRTRCLIVPKYGIITAARFAGQILFGFAAARLARAAVLTALQKYPCKQAFFFVV